jgi:hypothetical protein
VEYRIFGPGNTPSEDFRRDLQELLKLDDTQRNALADWFSTTQTYDPFGSELPQSIVASTLLPEQFRRAVQVLRRLLSNWQEYGLRLEDIERDLLLLGIDAEALKGFAPFLERLSGVKKKVWISDYVQTQTVDGLPTIDALNFICDARAVFGGYPLGDHHPRESYKQFLGVLPIVIMELVVSDNYGTRNRIAVQLSEESFEFVQKSIGKAQEQLAILKERTAALALDINGPQGSTQ